MVPSFSLIGARRVAAMNAPFNIPDAVATRAVSGLHARQLCLCVSQSVGDARCSMRFGIHDYAAMLGAHVFDRVNACRYGSAFCVADEAERGHSALRSMMISAFGMILFF